MSHRERHGGQTAEIPIPQQEGFGIARNFGRGQMVRRFIEPNVNPVVVEADNVSAGFFELQIREASRRCSNKHSVTPLISCSPIRIRVRPKLWTQTVAKSLANPEHYLGQSIPFQKRHLQPKQQFRSPSGTKACGNLLRLGWSCNIGGLSRLIRLSALHRFSEFDGSYGR